MPSREGVQRMKHNLKTLREICESEQAGAMVYDELDALEAELRHSLAWLLTLWHPRKGTQKAKRQAMIDKIEELAMIDKIEEFLGES